MSTPLKAEQSVDEQDVFKGSFITLLISNLRVIRNAANITVELFLWLAGSAQAGKFWGRGFYRFLKTVARQGEKDDSYDQSQTHQGRQ